MYEMGGSISYKEAVSLENPFLYVVWGEGSLPTYYYVVYYDEEFENELKTDRIEEGSTEYTIVEAATIGYESNGYAVYQYLGQEFSEAYAFGETVLADDLIAGAIESEGVNLILLVVMATV